MGCADLIIIIQGQFISPLLSQLHSRQIILRKQCLRANAKLPTASFLSNDLLLNPNCLAVLVGAALNYAGALRMRRRSVTLPGAASLASYGGVVAGEGCGHGGHLLTVIKVSGILRLVACSLPKLLLKCVSRYWFLSRRPLLGSTLISRMVLIYLLLIINCFFFVDFLSREVVAHAPRIRLPRRHAAAVVEVAILPRLYEL